MVSPEKEMDKEHGKGRNFPAAIRPDNITSPVSGGQDEITQEKQ
jgi:hypothetical protein